MLTQIILVHDRNNNIVGRLIENHTKVHFYDKHTNETRVLLYAGKFDSINEVPREVCAFVIGNALYGRNVSHKYLTSSKQRTPSSNKSQDSSKVLNTTIGPNDNALMIILKQAFDGHTEDSFKKLYTNPTEMNNCKKSLFDNPSGDFSWKRFIDITTRLGLVPKIQLTRDGYEI